MGNLNSDSNKHFFLCASGFVQKQKKFQSRSLSSSQEVYLQRMNDGMAVADMDKYTGQCHLTCNLRLHVQPAKLSSHYWPNMLSYFCCNSILNPLR